MRVVAIVLVVLALSAIAAVAGCYGLMRLGAASTEDEQRGAPYYACRDAARRQLRAPSTATFATLAESSRSEPGPNGLFRVSGYVDAENALGAKLRRRFTCEMRGERVLGVEFSE